MKEIIAGWNRDYFGGELSQACLEELDQIDAENRELVDCVDNWLFHFHMAGGRARNFSPLVARFFANTARSYMPSLWARIPPITAGGRLRVIDRVAHDVLGILPDQAIHFLTSDNDQLNRTLAEECGDQITAFLGGMGLCAQITPFGHLVIDLSHSHSEHYDQYFPVL